MKERTRFRFRVYDPETKEMAMPKRTKYYFCLMQDCKYFLWQDGFVAPVNPGLKVMQWTGLKDKNGRDIYEGDIVLFGENAVHENTYGKVIWLDSHVGFVYEFLNGQYKGKCTTMVDDWRTYEIVGNIYENPELLEELK